MNADDNQSLPALDYEALMFKAKEIPSKAERKRKLMPIIGVLREEKDLSWGDIQQWLIRETGFNHSAAHWMTEWKNWKKEQKAEVTA